MQGPVGTLCRAGLGDAQRASHKSGCQVWTCWVLARSFGWNCLIALRSKALPINWPITVQFLVNPPTAVKFLFDPFRLGRGGRYRILGEYLFASRNYIFLHSNFVSFQRTEGDLTKKWGKISPAFQYYNQNQSSFSVWRSAIQVLGKPSWKNVCTGCLKKRLQCLFV